MIGRMMMPTESDVDSVAYGESEMPESSRPSECPESSRIDSSRVESRVTPPPEDLREYGRILGADMQEADMDWVVREAFEAPLPKSWTEHVDGEGRVYFFNQVTEESTWGHPMDGVYRELILIIQSFRSSRPSALPEPRLAAVKEHLEQAHRRAIEQLESWSGPYVSETETLYFYNEHLEMSTWVNPVEDWEYELAVRQSLLYRCLLPDFADPTSADAIGANGQESLDPWMRLSLPLELAQPRDDDSQMSSRSFYSARESSRSGHSTERSLRELREALHSPSRARNSGDRTPGRDGYVKEAMPVALESCREEAAELETTVNSTESVKLFNVDNLIPPSH